MENPNKETLSYVIGLAIGDGNLSNPNGRATRLRITCDLRYPKLIDNIKNAIEILLPNNKVSTVAMKGQCLYISCYSNKWENWLGWQVGKGPKFKQKVHVPKWIMNDNRFTRACLRGLFETDGSIYKDRGYPMAMFTTTIPGLAKDVGEIISKLGFRAHTYKINRLNPIHLTRYNIRVSKNTEQFIKVVGIAKN